MYGTLLPTSWGGGEASSDAEDQDWAGVQLWMLDEGGMRAHDYD